MVVFIVNCFKHTLYDRCTNISNIDLHCMSSCSLAFILKDIIYQYGIVSSYADLFGKDKNKTYSTCNLILNITL